VLVGGHRPAVDSGLLLDRQPASSQKAVVAPELKAVGAPRDLRPRHRHAKVQYFLSSSVYLDAQLCVPAAAQLGA
jgi:hypothetical protein